MKSVIDGTVYDTEQAEQLARNYLMGPSPDEGYERETLYKTADGTYLLHYQRGSRIWDQHIIRIEEIPIAEEALVALDSEEVINWCEDRGVVNDRILDEFEDDLDRL